MKVTLYSNYLNHLQTAFCDEMYKTLGTDFKFVSTERLPVDRLGSGYQDCSHYPYNINSFESDADYNKALQLGITSDIVILGDAPEVFIDERISQNKPTFKYSERLLKHGYWQLFDPREIYSLWRYHTRLRKKNVYMLCASAFTSNDLSLISAYPDKKFKWGYFTEVKESNVEQILDEKPKELIEIIWTARFLKWKHPELAVELAFELRKRGYNFHLNMIGTGEMQGYIESLIRKLDVSGYVSLSGSMPNSEVRSKMQKSNIFIFTSDRNEGWGVVLNEAMNNGCAVVASDKIGAVTYLIEHGENGMIFKSGSLSGLLEHTENLINDSVLRNKLSKNAYYTLFNKWNPKIASSNFILLSKSILENKIFSIDDGPCSKA